MYDEIERAVGGRPRRRMSLLGWIAIALVGFSLLGVAGAVVGFLAVREEVREAVEVIRHDGRVLATRGMSDAMAGAVAGSLARLGPDVLADDPDAGWTLVRSLRSGRVDAAELQDIVDASLRIRTERGEVTAALRGDERGGELVIRSPDGDATVELVRSEEGGILEIRSGEGTVRLASGVAESGLPRWVPRPPGMPDEPVQVVSASSGRGFFRAVAWEAGEPPEALVDRYRERLEEEDYTLRAEHAARAGGSRTASVMGRSEDGGRTVFLITSVEDGATRALLLFGEDVRESRSRVR